MISRREFLKRVGAGASALGFAGCSWSYRKSAKSGAKPNIVFIMADDMGYGDVSCYNPASKIRTPNMDALAEQGVRFTDAHSPSAVCTPTRYGVLTGRYCWRTRLKRGVLNGFSQPLISREQMTVAELLKSRGYRTACIGKWHLGVGWQTKDGAPAQNSKDADRVDFSKAITDGPNQHGFDYSFITAACSTVDSPYVFIENGRCTAQPTATMVRTGPVSEFGSRGGPMVPGWSNEDVDLTYVEKTRLFLEKHKAEHADRPFFVYLPVSAPHAPWLPPDFVKGKSGTGPRGDLVVLVDWCVGEIVKSLERMGLAEDTLVIVTSDNGPRIGKAGHNSAGPFRGYKSHTCEGGHRIPFIARWPGVIEPGRVESRLVCLIDLMATCAAVVDTGLDEDTGPDSFNMLPALVGKAPAEPVRDNLVSHSSKGVFAIRQGGWKLILDTKGSGGWVDPRDSGPRAGSEGQLYNLAEDPYEEYDLWAEHPEVVERLTGLLEEIQSQGRSKNLEL